jgi:hypothetical protein
MSERAYTVKEIDALRRACRERVIWGSSVMSHLYRGRSSGSYKASEADQKAEEMVRTFMLAGITAEQVKEQDQSAEDERTKAALTGLEKADPEYRETVARHYGHASYAKMCEWTSQFAPPANKE